MTEPWLDLVPDLVRSRKRNGLCMYNKAAKRELVRRCLLPGVSLARTALDHGLNANLLRKWVVNLSGTRLPRRNARGLAVTQVPLLAVAAQQPRSSPMRTLAEGYLELVVASGTIRVHGCADARALSIALDCLARRA